MTSPGSRLRLFQLAAALVSTLLAGSVVWMLVGPAPAVHPASGFLEDEADYYRYDPVAGHLHQRGARRVLDWPEHPRSRIEMRTNNLGLREDEPTQIERTPGRRRILVTGDSHTDGVVFNAESFVNLIEACLGAGAEVLNGGHGYYSAHNYLGFYDWARELRPDVFVVALFSGNDFLDVLAHGEQTGALQVPDRPVGYRESLARIGTIQGEPYAGPGQGLNQAFFFRHFPHLERVSLMTVQRNLSELAERCRSDSTALLIVVLPTLLDVEWEHDGLRNRQAVDRLPLTPEQLAVNRRLSVGLMEWLAQEQIPHLDLLPAMLPAAGTLYWKRDHHLSLDGHRVVADAILERHANLLRGD